MFAADAIWAALITTHAILLHAKLSLSLGLCLGLLHHAAIPIMQERLLLLLPVH